MIRAFHDPATPVGVCGCGEIIAPHEDICPDCLASAAVPVNLDPVMIAILIICTAGIGILVPLTWGLIQIWRGR